MALGGGKLAFTIGGGGTPAHRATLPASARRIGTLVVASHKGRLRQVADLMRFEARHDPDGQGADSDPTGLIRRGSHFLATDSGGNDLLRAGGGDPIRVLATFGQPHGQEPVRAGERPDAGGAHCRGGRARRSALRQ